MKQRSVKSVREIVVLMADDDEDDRLLAQDALRESGSPHDLRFVSDGVELFEYLEERGAYADPQSAPRPDIILLDLNMPRLDGREALRVLKLDPRWRRTPVVVLTTSKAEEDVLRSYDLGANSYIPKPVTFEGLVEVMRNLARYWSDTVQLPPEGSP